MKSLYTNYEEGLDRDVLNLLNKGAGSDADEVAVEDWKQKIRAEKKARGEPWTLDVRER